MGRKKKKGEQPKMVTFNIPEMTRQRLIALSQKAVAIQQELKTTQGRIADQLSTILEMEGYELSDKVQVSPDFKTIVLNKD